MDYAGNYEWKVIFDYVHIIQVLDDDQEIKEIRYFSWGNLYGLLWWSTICNNTLVCRLALVKALQPLTLWIFSRNCLPFAAICEILSPAYEGCNHRTSEWESINKRWMKEVAKVLYLTRWSWSNFWVITSFKCTPITWAMTEDARKVSLVMGYLQRIIYKNNWKAGYEW